MMKPTLLALAAVALGGCGLAASLVADALYDEHALPAEHVRADLAYLPDGLDKHRLNLFLPLDDSVRAEPWPVVVFVHGGGWVEGDRDFAFGGEDIYNNVGRYFAARGVGAAVVSYRLLPGVDWPTQLADVAAAVAVVQDTIPSFGGDPGAMVLMGHSAGAQLAARVAYDPAVRAQAGADPVCAVSSISGAALDLIDPATWRTGTEFDYYARRFSPTAEPLDGPPEVPYDWQAAASPATYVSPGAPRTLVVYADGEEPLFRTQAAALAHRLAAAGVPHEVREMPALNHEAGVFNLSHPGKVAAPATLALARGC